MRPWSVPIAITCFGVGAAALVVAVSQSRVASSRTTHPISQKGRTFAPGKIGIHLNETLTVVNDDANLVHHAYIDAPSLSFDSGDQEPGGKAVITFPTAGDFMVLCAIHPKMTLAVRVRE